jgi:hypothetical protein
MRLRCSIMGITPARRDPCHGNGVLLIVATHQS